MINFDETHIGYQTSIVKVGVSNIKKGQLVALIGSNGSGKSTFLKTLAGLQAPFSGSIRINNKNIESMSRTEIAQTIAYVPSQFPVVDYLNVVDFIRLGRTPYLTNLGRLTQEDQQIVEEAIQQLNIHHLTHKNTTQLSDGERQLCSIARALAQQTSIILLDEPTNFLDYRNKRRLLQTLTELCQHKGLTILFSTHDLDVLKEINVQRIGITATEKPKVLQHIEENTPFEKIIMQFYS